MRALLRISMILLLPAIAACGGRSGGAVEPVARLTVENRSSSDVDIYLRPALRPSARLGFVPASDTVDFALAPALISGAVSFHLEARPTSGGRRIISEPFTARAGETITWSIPP